MANDGNIDKDTLFGPERIEARAIDWDQSDRGLSSRRAVTMLQSRRRIHGRNRNHARINRNALAPREPSIHGSRTMASALLEGAADIFERGGKRAPEIDEETVRSLHAKIGELAVANDLYEEVSVKGAKYITRPLDNGCHAGLA